MMQHEVASRLLGRHQIQVVTQWDTNRTDWVLGTTLRAPGQAKDYEVDSVRVHRLGLSLFQKALMTPFVPLYQLLPELALPPISSQLMGLLDPYADEADIIHNTRIGREGLSRASYDLARKHGIPFVLTPVHHPRWKGWRYRAYINLYRNADMVLALTHSEKNQLLQFGVDQNRVAVTGIGPKIAAQANPASFLRSERIGGPVVLFIGQHFRYKGFDHLLRAMPIVWRIVPETHFVFIGPSTRESASRFAGINHPQVHNLGPVSLQKKTDALAASTLLCVPSVQESFGAVYLEAWAFNKPVIGCPIPAVSEVIDDGSDGYLTPQEPNAIAGRITDLLLNPQRAEAMGQAGNVKMAMKYSWDKVVERTEQAYRVALGEGI